MRACVRACVSPRATIIDTSRVRARRDRPDDAQVYACGCDASVVRLAEGAPEAVRISIEADGFLYHQIRKVVGLAVAVAGGSFGLGEESAGRGRDVIDGVLTSPARVAGLPLAPPHTLVCCRADFTPFRLGYSVGTESLAMGEAGEARAEAFWRDALAAQIAEGLEHADWCEFEETLARMKERYNEKDVRELIERCKGWKERMVVAKEEKCRGSDGDDG